MKPKLIGLFLLISIISISAVGLLSGRIAVEIINQQSFDKLEAVGQIKKAQIKWLFKERFGDAQILAKTIEAIGGAKSLNKWDKESLAFFNAFPESYGYKNIFFIMPDGYLFYNLTKKQEYNANIYTDKYSRTLLSKGARTAIETGKTQLSDIEMFPDVSGEPAAFIIQPIMIKGKIDMLVALQISPKQINSIMLERSGMESTGESVLIGTDKKMRCDSYLDPVNHSLIKSLKGTVEKNGVDTFGTNEALAGRSGRTIYTDYRGNKALAAYSPIDLKNIRWAIVAKIDESEVRKPIERLINRIILVAFIILMFVSILAVILASKFTRPLRKGAVFARSVSDGNLDAKIEEIGTDEVAELLQAVEKMKDDLRQSQINILESEEKFRAMVEAFDGFIYVCSDDYKIEFMSKKTIEKIGYNAIGDFCYKAIYKRDDVCPWCVNERVFAGETMRWESYSEKTGKWYYHVNAPIYHANGAMSKQSMVTDITDRKRLEQDLIDKNRELGDFASTVSHNLKSSINIIAGYMDLMKEEPELIEEGQARIRSEFERLVLYVNNLLKLSRAGKIIGEKIVLKPADIIRGIFNSINTPNGAAVLEITEPLPDIIGEEEGITRVFTNIIENAFKNSDPDKDKFSLKVGQITSKNDITVYFEDNGTGIKPGMIERIFAPGVTSGKKDGTGFGLTISRKIIEAHGGALWAESKGPGQGTTFYVRLPKEPKSTSRSHETRTGGIKTEQDEDVD